jgi:hypothetical protein
MMLVMVPSLPADLRLLLDCAGWFRILSIVALLSGFAVLRKTAWHRCLPRRKPIFAEKLAPSDHGERTAQIESKRKHLTIKRDIQRNNAERIESYRYRLKGRTK